MMTQPKINPFDGAGIPTTLKAQKRWAPWRAVLNAKKGKFDKVPHNPHRPEFGISTTKPERWGSFEQAMAAYLADPVKFSGVGYVMTGPHGVVGIDLDHCVEGDVIAPWAAEVAAKIDSYTEISPSGTGLRILCAGEVPADWNNHDIGIEVYGGNEARFLTVTGDQVPGSRGDVRAAPAGVLERMAARHAKERRKADVIDLNMPELLDDMMLPDLADIDVAPAVRDFLTDGRHSGDRSRALYAAAMALYRTGMDDAEVFSILVSSGHAMEIALDHRRQDYDRALLYIWREHCCKGKARAAEFKALTLADFDETEGHAPSIADDFDVVEGSTAGPSVAPPKKAKAPRFTVQLPASFAAAAPQEWIVKGILPMAELCILFGASGSGKSFLALDIAGAVATGAAWRGRRVKKGRSVYIAAEGAGGVRKRLLAYGQQHDVDLGGLDIGIIPDSPNLCEKADITDLVKAIRTFGKVSIIWVDTFAQAFQGNENSGEDVQRALSHCKLLHQATGALVVLIAHSGKDASKGVRGWSGLRGAADAQIEVIRSGEQRAAIIDKQKDGGGEGDEFGFKLNIVTLGHDEDGDAITSCTVLHTEGAAPVASINKGPKGAVERLVLRILEDMAGLSDAGNATPESALAEACVTQMPLEKGKRDRRREVVARAITALTAAGRIILDDGNVRVSV